MILTEEQKSIIQSDAKNIRINAYAGCGKTSTLMEFAKQRPSHRFLYIAFNRGVKEEAEKKFTKNVQCKTTHALAYPMFGSLYRHKLGYPKPYHLSSLFKNMSQVSGGFALETLNHFLTSKDSEITNDHAALAKVESERQANIVNYAKEIWKSIQDVNSSIPMPHDGYLKLFQLSKPQLKFDYILFDEAQDANPPTIEILSYQKCGKVIVGDQYQAIYGFRNAINAMNCIPFDADYSLTHSFRFGEGIADLASAILKDWRNEEIPLTGKGKNITEWSVDLKKPHAILARTNAGLFEAAINVLKNPLGFSFAGGIENYKFDMILDAYHISRRHMAKVNDKFLKSFTDWEVLKAYAKELDDRELSVLIRIVEKYGDDTPILVDQIKKGAQSNLPMDHDCIVLTTAHKAKGMEWDSVILLDDFADLQVQFDKKTGKAIQPDQEEIHLIYVACTRALRSLQVNSSIMTWLHECGHHLLLNEIRFPNRAKNQTKPLEIDREIVKKTPVGSTEWMKEMIFSLRNGMVLNPEDRIGLALALEALTTPSLPINKFDEIVLDAPNPIKKNGRERMQFRL